MRDTASPSSNVAPLDKCLSIVNAYFPTEWSQHCLTEIVLAQDETTTFNKDYAGSKGEVDIVGGKHCIPGVVVEGTIH